jgi:hypothetical protein
MIKLALVLLVACTSTAIADDTPSTKHTPLSVYEEYDRITDRTTIEVDLGPVANPDVLFSRVQLSIASVYPGKTRPKKGTTAIILSAGNKEWTYLRDHELTLLVDGSRLRLKPKHDGSVHSGYVLEVLTSSVDLADLDPIASGKSAEGKLGSTEFRVSPAQQEAIKVFLHCFTDPAFDPNKSRVEAEAEAARARKATEAKDAAIAAEEFAKAKAKDAADIEAAEKMFEEATALAKIPKTVKALELYRKIVSTYPKTDAARRADVKIKAIQKARR